MVDTGVALNDSRKFGSTALKVEKVGATQIQL